MAITLRILLLLSICHGTEGFKIKVEDVDSLLMVVKEALGNEHYEFAKKRTGSIERSLYPTYNSMRKNEHGQLGHGAASYALYRLFGQRHGWQVAGLVDSPERSFKAWSASSPTALLRKGVPESTLKALEQQFFDDGFSLHELAVVAATIERFIQAEAKQRLESVFQAQHISKTKFLDRGEVDHALDAYISLYLIKELVHLEGMPTTKQLERVLNMMPKLYPGWHEVQEFVHEVEHSTIRKRDHWAFPEVELVAQEIGERFGRWQDQQCRSMKHLMFSEEDTGPGGAGRMRLADFYNLTLSGKQKTFSESTSTLREVGALDESDSSNPRVIISNYIYGANNCVASSSKYYEVCCINQCNDMMTRVEREVASPEATSEQIVQVASSLASPEYPKGKRISSWLRHELQMIADYHGGRIPLHGRLFAQWMHYAFPRECPFPHAKGASHDMHLASFTVDTKTLKNAVASQEEMQRIVHAATPRSEKILDAEAHEALRIKSMEEELVAV